MDCACGWALLAGIVTGMAIAVIGLICLDLAGVDPDSWA